ncbi:ankyrin repeat domain-containing protein [Natronospira bacteriovora]|uniref:Ankyrin repeat domain-containing protein n=1 Tax=Natronospira bacteriovora TaxID=3069753 RepID=A0ABU0WAH3_9GAMM|nr:ankyrin repeat domain-containing protein [Natronospira sp. AB-CW4]MDQ2070768.1 ankyrin repeat domain-containing protein [Natronospira sp. AB-CW4]
MRTFIYVMAFTAVSLTIAVVLGSNSISGENAMGSEVDSKPVAHMSAREMFPDRRVRALARAAGRGSIDRIDGLVEKSIDVNYQGRRGATPLFWAMQNAAGFRRLLEHGANPNVVFDDGGSVMHWAARAEDSDILKTALEFGGDPNLVAGEEGITPIFRALTNRRAIEILLESGANIDAQKRGWKLGDRRIGGGITPVMEAADLAQFDIVLFLLESGADFRIESDRGDTLADLVASYQGAFKAGSSTEKAYKEVIVWLCDRGVSMPESECQ